MNPAQHILVFILRIYRCVFSPMIKAVFGPAGGCRFTPTCSQYAMQAVQIHGALRGSALAGLRLCRCHPWGGSGHDPVPEKDFTSHWHGRERRVLKLKS
ncbi:MAG: membrane protein insertion efficiency factor YidD [Verrucomicrobia bacterium]|nr:membrane protein insertion efficiency factor YidD [Verrucomicrobiota bacterium]